MILRREISFVIASADIRHPSKLILRIDGRSPSVLRSHAGAPEHITYVLTNPAMEGLDATARAAVEVLEAVLDRVAVIAAAVAIGFGAVRITKRAVHP